AADRDARKWIEEREDRVPNPAADVFKIDVYALRACCGQLFGEVRRPMINDFVEAQLIAHERALSRAAGDAHSARALDHGDLAYRRADRPAGRGHYDCLSRLWLADVQQPCPGCKSGHAQHAERGCDRRGGRIELSQVFAVRDRMSLPT